MLEQFIKKNKEFQKELQLPEKRNGNLLIEEASICFIRHCLAVQALLLTKAKSYSPVWIKNNATPIELLKSYDKLAKFSNDCNFNVFEKLKIKILSKLAYLKLKKTSDIIQFTYDGIKYGDLVYDVYLTENQVGTIKKINKKIYHLINRCITRHEYVKKILKKENISAVLISDRIGMFSGVLYRTALRYGCEIYSSAGLHRNTLFRSKNMDEMIEFEYAPSKENINEMLSLSDDEFNQLYDFVKDFHLNGNATMDAKFAFSDSNTYYSNKADFAKDYNLDVNKKNIFIMLHAFTDYPHSHFKGMLFNDYADWFFKTLDYAKQNKEVNWIFKQHPSNKFYPTKDINFKKLFNDISDNIIFVDENDKLDTRSLIHIADAVVTCVGSAGFELPALGGVPSITAGDNHYQDLGFSKHPKTLEQYFSILDNLKNIEKLTFEQQKRAQAAFIFIYYLSTVDYSINPILTMEDHHNPDIDKVFYNKLIDIYNNKKDTILNEFKLYVEKIKEDDFKALRTSIKV